MIELRVISQRDNSKGQDNKKLNYLLQTWKHGFKVQSEDSLSKK